MISNLPRDVQVFWYSCAILRNPLKNSNITALSKTPSARSEKEFADQENNRDYTVGLSNYHYPLGIPG